MNPLTRRVSTQALKNAARSLRDDLNAFDRELPCEASLNYHRSGLRRVVGRLLDLPEHRDCTRPAAWQITVTKTCGCNHNRVGLLCEAHYELMVEVGLFCDQCSAAMLITWAERVR